MPAYIQTFFGLMFKPLEPEMEDILIEDVAHALSNKCRYSGHTKWFYSVAQHACLVQEALAKEGFPLNVQFAGLHHDDSEAYLPDVPTPLKRLPEFEFFRKVEDKIQALCFEKFGVWFEDYAPIKAADIAVFHTERNILMKPHLVWTVQSSGPPANVEILKMTPEEAEACFLHTHNRLMGLLTSC